MPATDWTFYEVYHPTLENDISIASRFYLEEEEAEAYATELLKLLPPDVPIGMREIQIHTGQIHPIVKASVTTDIIRSTGTEKEGLELETSRCTRPAHEPYQLTVGQWNRLLRRITALEEANEPPVFDDPRDTETPGL